MSLIALPAEVLQHIFRYLDSRDALRICTVNSILRNHAESTLWRDISMNDTLAPHAPHADVWQHDAPLSPLIGVTAITKHFGTGALTDLLILIKANPARRIYLKHLKLQFRFNTPSELDELLQDLGPGLQSLEWRTSGPAFYASHSMTAGLRVLSNLENKLVNLKQLYMTIRTDWVRTMAAIARAARRLEVLEVNSHPRLIRSSTSIESARPPMLRMPCLRAITVGNMERSFVPLLAAIIDHNDTIETVELNDYSFTWQPGLNDALVAALARAKSLKQLKMSATVLPVIQQLQGFEGLGRLSVLWGADNLGALETEPPLLPKLRSYELSFSTFTSAGELDLMSDPAEMWKRSVKVLDGMKAVFTEHDNLERVVLKPGMDRSSARRDRMILERP